MIAATLPMNGAVEKYALVRAVPRPRNASTNKTRLMPYPRKPTTPAMSESKSGVWSRQAKEQESD
jgi:hypothetical protein